MRTSNKNMKKIALSACKKFYKKSPAKWQGIFQILFYALKSTMEYIANAHTASKQNGIKMNSDLLQANARPQVVIVSITAYSFMLSRVL